MMKLKQKKKSFSFGLNYFLFFFFGIFVGEYRKGLTSENIAFLSENKKENFQKENVMETRSGIASMERCAPKFKEEFNIEMGDIHSTNPYQHFSPTNYDIAGPDLIGWGIDPQHKIIMDVTKPRFMVEVGSFKGLSATNFAKQMRSSHEPNDCLLLICVDTWLGTTTAWESPDKENPTHGNTLYLRNGYPSLYYQFLYNVIDEKHHDMIVPLPLPGVMGAIFLRRKNAKPDTIFIDGCHDEECVYEDIKRWFPILKNKGIMFGDDYFTASVKKAVSKFCAKNTQCTLDPDLSSKRTWVIRKN